MSSKLQKLQKQLIQLSSCCSFSVPFTIQSFLKQKLSQLDTSTINNISINWKQQIMQAYTRLRQSDQSRERLVILAEDILFQSTKCIKNKQIQIQMISNQLLSIKNTVQEQKVDNQRVNKQYQKTINNLRNQLQIRIQKLEYKQFEIRQLYDKIHQYQQQIQEMKSSQYQNMLDTIKQQQLLSTQTKIFQHETNQLKLKLKQQSLLRNHLSRQLKSLSEQLQKWKSNYYRIKIRNNQNHSNSSKRQESPNNFFKGNSTDNIKVKQYKEEFSFKDDIQNSNQQSNQTVIQNNHSQGYYQGGYMDCNQFGIQDSVGDRPLERDVLNLTNRDRSTISKTNKSNLSRSKRTGVVDKQNVSQNTLEFIQNSCQIKRQKNSLQNYGLSFFGSKKNSFHQTRNHNKFTSNCSIQQVYLPSPIGFQTQQRNEMKSHRKIKSSFCGIKQFKQFESNNFILNSQKLKESIFEEDQCGEYQHQDLQNQHQNQQDKYQKYQRNKQYQPQKNQQQYHNNTIGNQSSILLCDVNQIVINQELIASKRPKNQSNQPKIDIYYAFFSLTVQCAKLNAKNFNQVISVYFDLDKQYKNLLNQRVPINKWYEIIAHKLQNQTKAKPIKNDNLNKNKKSNKIR